MQAFKRFLLRELLFTIFVAVVAFLLFSSLLTDYYLPIFWILLGVIAILTGIFHYSLIQIQENRSSKFSQKFMMVSGIKMMIYLVFITSYAFMNPEKATSFLISFFILYILYTVFEVILIVRYLKNK